MRRVIAVARVAESPQIPRGWVLVGSALFCWGLIAGLWAVTNQLFGMIVAAL